MSAAHERGLRLLTSVIETAVATKLQRILCEQQGHQYPKAVRFVVAALRSASVGVVPAADDDAGLERFVLTCLDERRPPSRTARLQKIRVVTSLEGTTRLTPPMPEDSDRLALFAPGLVDEEVCQQLIARTEAMGYRQAVLSLAGGGSVTRRDIRDNDTVVRTDASFAAQLWERKGSLVRPRCRSPDFTSPPCGRCRLGHGRGVPRQHQGEA